MALTSSDQLNSQGPFSSRVVTALATTEYLAEVERRMRRLMADQIGMSHRRSYPSDYAFNSPEAVSDAIYDRAADSTHADHDAAELETLTQAETMLAVSLILSQRSLRLTEGGGAVSTLVIGDSLSELKSNEDIARYADEYRRRAIELIRDVIEGEGFYFR